MTTYSRCRWCFPIPYLHVPRRHTESLAVDNLQCFISSRLISLTDGFRDSVIQVQSSPGWKNNKQQNSNAFAEPGLEQQKLNANWRGTVYCRRQGILHARRRSRQRPFAFAERQPRAKCEECRRGAWRTKCPFYDRFHLAAEALVEAMGDGWKPLAGCHLLVAPREPIKRRGITTA